MNNNYPIIHADGEPTLTLPVGRQRNLEANSHVKTGDIVLLLGYNILCKVAGIRKDSFYLEGINKTVVCKQTGAIYNVYTSYTVNKDSILKTPALELLYGNS